MDDKGSRGGSPAKDGSISELMQQSMYVASPACAGRAGTPTDLSTTMLNTSALSWASSFNASPLRDRSGCALNTSHHWPGAAGLNSSGDYNLFLQWVFGS